MCQEKKKLKLDNNYFLTFSSFLLFFCSSQKCSRKRGFLYLPPRQKERMYKNLVMIDTCSRSPPLPPQKNQGERRHSLSPTKKRSAKRRKSVLGHRAWKPSKEEEEEEENGFFFRLLLLFRKRVWERRRAWHGFGGGNSTTPAMDLTEESMFKVLIIRNRFPAFCRDFNMTLKHFRFTFCKN